MDSPRHILIDGYNIIHAWPELAAKLKSHGREVACAALIEKVQQLHDTVGARVTIVFDGKGASLSVERPGRHTTFSVIYTPSGQTADDVIEQLVASAQEPRMTTVATNDTALANTVAALGGENVSSEKLQDWLLHLGRQQSDSLARYNRGAEQKWRGR